MQKVHRRSSPACAFGFWFCLFASSPSMAQNFPTALVTIDPSVPASAARMVSYIISPLGQAPIGSSVEIPPLDPGAETILLASNSNNDTILAAMYSTGGTKKTFTSASTAVAISRLIQGPLPTGLTDAQMDSAIEATAEFPNLLSLINKDLAAGIPPQNDPGFPLSVTTVLGEALKAMAASQRAPISK